MVGHLERIGQQIGEYRLLRWLGGGGFGNVYLGEQVRGHSQAAVKLLQIRLSRSEELKAFINEARTIRLKHPHIIPLLDFGISREDIPFLVMEYAVQGTLRDRHPKGAQVPLTAVVSYVQQVASALLYAHEQRLIHRDVKPENMLLRADGTLLLSDFGIASVAHSSHSLSLHQGIGGTIPYMAPEQIQGQARTASDQYSLGVVAYEWIAGRRPFEGAAVEVAMQHAMKLPPSLTAQVPTLSREVDQVVLKALAKDSGDRFVTVQDFAVALGQAVQGMPHTFSSGMPHRLLPPVMPEMHRASPLGSSEQALSPYPNVLPAPSSPESPPLVSLQVTSPHLSGSSLLPPMTEIGSTGQSALPMPSSANVETSPVAEKLPQSIYELSSQARSDLPPLRQTQQPSPSNAGSSSAPSNAVSAPQVAVTMPKQKRNRLPLPTIVMAILLVVAVVGAGSWWYFLRPLNAQARLDSASVLINQAKSNISSKPSQALTSLTRAQQELHSLNDATLNPQQSSQLASLQNDLTTEFKTALNNFNQQSSVITLPCTNLAPIPLTSDGPAVQTSTMALLQTDKDHTTSFVLGLDGIVYQVNDQHVLQKVSLANDKVILLSSDNQYLYTLTFAQAGANYRLHAYKWQNNKLIEKINNGTIIKPELITNQMPLLMTAWGGDIYVISAFTQANQQQATLLNYHVDKLDKEPQAVHISISTRLVSAAALPNGELFLLHSDGQIKSLQFNIANPLETGVLVQQTVNTPWFQDAQTFNVATPIATPTDPIIKFLSIPPPTAQTRQSLLSVGMVNNKAHLFVVDNTNHRVLNFAVTLANAAIPAAKATATATPDIGDDVIAPAGNLPKASLEQQYVSANVVNGVKSTAFDARTNHINLLVGASNSEATNQIAIDVSSTTACHATP